MPEVPPLNPYEPPSSVEEAPARPIPEFLPILRRWRPLRFKFNLIIFVVGLLSSIRIWQHADPTIFIGIFFYALFANLFFTAGVIPEIIMAVITRESDYPTLRIVSFILGLLFSIFLTIVVGWEVSNY